MGGKKDTKDNRSPTAASVTKRIQQIKNKILIS